MSSAMSNLAGHAMPKCTQLSIGIFLYKPDIRVSEKHVPNPSSRNLNLIACSQVLCKLTPTEASHVNYEALPPVQGPGQRASKEIFESTRNLAITEACMLWLHKLHRHTNGKLKVAAPKPRLP